MQALLAAYGESDGESDGADDAQAGKRQRTAVSPGMESMDESKPSAASPGALYNALRPLSLPSLPPPPLPAAFPSDESDASTRPMRQFAHVDGHFATHVFMPVSPPIALQQSLSACMSELCGKDRSVQMIDSKAYHVSLSRTLVLTRPQLQGFAEALRVALRRCAPCCPHSARTPRVL